MLPMDTPKWTLQEGCLEEGQGMDSRLSNTIATALPNEKFELPRPPQLQNVFVVPPIARGIF